MQKVIIASREYTDREKINACYYFIVSHLKFQIIPMQFFFSYIFTFAFQSDQTIKRCYEYMSNINISKSVNFQSSLYSTFKKS